MCFVIALLLKTICVLDLSNIAVRTAHDHPIMYAGFIYDLRMRAAAVNVFNTVRFLAEVYHVFRKCVICLRI